MTQPTESAHAARACLDRCGFAAGWPEALRAELAGRLEPASFEPGATIFSEGDPAFDALIIESGTAIAWTRDQLGEEVPLADVSAGELVGEVALLQDGVRSASLRTREAVRGYRLAREDFERLLAARPELAGTLRTGVETLTRRSFLRSASPFSGLGGDTLLELARRLSTRDASAGDIVTSEGDTGEELFLIRSGRLSASVRGKRQRSMGPGDCFGEVALLGDGRRTATVRADTGTELYVLHREDFAAACDAHAALKARFAEFARIRAARSTWLAAAVPDPIETLMPLLDSNRRRFQWRLVLAGLALTVAFLVAARSGAPAVTGVLAVAIGHLIGPVAFVTYLLNSQFLVGRAGVAIALLACGALVGAPLAWWIENGVVPATTTLAGAAQAAMLVSLIEESAKLAPVALLLGARRYRFQLDGLLLGVAGGMGFAVFENVLHSPNSLAGDGWTLVVTSQWIHALIAPMTHATWTALMAAALWRWRYGGERDGAAVLAACLQSVLLHALWDFDFLPSVALYQGVWQPLVGLAGLVALRAAFVRGLEEQGHSILALDPGLADGVAGTDGARCSFCSQTAVRGARYCVRCGAVLRRTSHPASSSPTK